MPAWNTGRARENSLLVLAMKKTVIRIAVASGVVFAILLSLLISTLVTGHPDREVWSILGQFGETVGSLAFVLAATSLLLGVREFQEERTATEVRHKEDMIAAEQRHREDINAAEARHEEDMVAAREWRDSQVR